MSSEYMGDQEPAEKELESGHQTIKRSACHKGVGRVDHQNRKYLIGHDGDECWITEQAMTWR